MSKKHKFNIGDLIEYRPPMPGAWWPAMSVNDDLGLIRIKEHTTVVIIDITQTDDKDYAPMVVHCVKFIFNGQIFQFLVEIKDFERSWRVLVPGCDPLQGG